MNRKVLPLHSPRVLVLGGRQHRDAGKGALHLCVTIVVILCANEVVVVVVIEWIINRVVNIDCRRRIRTKVRSEDKCDRKSLILAIVLRIMVFLVLVLTGGRNSSIHLRL